MISPETRCSGLASLIVPATTIDVRADPAEAAHFAARGS